MRAAVTATVPGPGAAAGLFIIAPFLVAAAGPVIRRWRLRQLLTDGRFRGLAGQAAGTALTTALRPLGIKQAAVRLGQVAGLARAFRAGPQAVVLVHEAVLTRPDLSGFCIAPRGRPHRQV